MTPTTPSAEALAAEPELPTPSTLAWDQGGMCEPDRPIKGYTEGQMRKHHEAWREVMQNLLRQLARWQQKYGEHQPDWLPPAGDVRAAEDAAELLAQPAPGEAEPKAQAQAAPSRDEMMAMAEEAGVAPNTILHFEQAFLRFAALLSKRLAAPSQAQAAEPAERETLQLIDQRDHAYEVIDAILDAVLGKERPEWSSAYGTHDAVVEVQEKMAMLTRSLEDALRPIEPPAPIDLKAVKWHPGPTRSRWGDGMLMADVELSPDETLTMFIHKDALPLVQVDHIPAPPELSAQVDESLGLKELPPIRVGLALHCALVVGAAAKGVVLQAHVRDLLSSQAQAGGAL